MNDNPYLTPQWGAPLPAEGRSMRHSGLGIASFLISIVAAIFEAGLIVAAGVLEASTPGGMDEESVAAMLIGLGICGGAFVNLVAIGLGIGGLCQRDRKKLFAVLGLVFCCAQIVGVGLLMLVGLMMD